MSAELHIVCATAERQPSRLDTPWSAGEPPRLSDICLAATQAAPAERWLLSGGEPTLRPDLPELITRLSEGGHPLGMRTDGLLLSRPGVDAQLHRAGLSFVRIALHSGRADAHDWLVRLPGACARVRKALTHCADGPLDLEAEITLTRPTSPYLVETISLLIRHQVTAIHIRFLECMGPAADDYVALAPRIGLLQPALEEGIRQALRHEVAIHLSGFPLCAAPAYPECHRAQDEISYALPLGITRPEADRAKTGCPGCPGTPQCTGAPRSYARLFGWSEVQSEGGLQARTHAFTPTPTPTSGDTVAPPPGRAGRAPATRIRAAIQQAERPNLGGDPLAGRTPSPAATQTLAIEFSPDLPTRVLRMRMVRAAQNGAPTLRIQGQSLKHPQAHDLLREAQRLSFTYVEVWGDGAALETWTDPEIRHLRDLQTMTLLHPPNAPQAASALAERIMRLANIQVNLTTEPLPSTPALLWTDESGGTTHRDSG